MTREASNTIDVTVAGALQADMLSLIRHGDADVMGDTGCESDVVVAL